MVSVRSIAGLQLSLVVDQPFLLSVADAADVSERRNLIGINLLTIEHRQTSERNDTGSLVVVVDRLRIRYYCSLWTARVLRPTQLPPPRQRPRTPKLKKTNSPTQTLKSTNDKRVKRLL